MGRVKTRLIYSPHKIKHMKQFIEKYLIGIIGTMLGIWAIYLGHDIIDRIVMGIFTLSIITITLTEASESKQQ